MGFLGDIRFGLRLLTKDRVFSLAAVLALALSVGANTAVFTLVKSVLLQPLAMKNPEQLVVLQYMRPDGTRWPFNIPNFIDIRDRNQALQDVAASGGWNANLTGEANPERLLGVRVTGNFFTLSGWSRRWGD